MSESVRVFLREHMSATARPNFTSCSLHVARGRDSVVF